MRLQHRISFNELQEVELDTGSTDTSWQQILTVWGQLKPLKSHEQYSHQKIDVKSDFELTVRRSSEIIASVSSECRVTYDGRDFEIVSEPTDYKMDKRFLTILLREVNG